MGLAGGAGAGAGALIGGPPKPRQGLGAVLIDTFAFHVHETQTVLRDGMALFSGSAHVFSSPRLIGDDTKPVLIHDGTAML